jgi:hypothetical protein
VVLKEIIAGYVDLLLVWLIVVWPIELNDHPNWPTRSREIQGEIDAF